MTGPSPPRRVPFVVSACAAVGCVLAAAAVLDAAGGPQPALASLDPAVDAGVRAGGAVAAAASDLLGWLRIPGVLAIAAALTVGWRRQRLGPDALLCAALGLAVAAQSFLLDGGLAPGVVLYAASIAIAAARPDAPEPAPSALDPRLETACVLAALGVFAAAALHHLDVHPALYFDEAAYATAARMRLGEIEPGWVRGYWSYLGPIGYEYELFRAQGLPLNLQAAAIRALGPGILTTRLVSALAAALALWVVWLGLRDRLGPRAALWMLVLASASPLALAYSRPGFYIGFSILHGALLFATVVRLVERPHVAWAALAGVLAGSALYHYQLTWFLPVFAAATVLACPSAWRAPGATRVALAGALATAVCVLPGLVLRRGMALVAAQTFDRAVWSPGVQLETGALERALAMLARLAYAPGVESAGRNIESPILAPVLLPLLVLGAVEALRRRDQLVMRALIVFGVGGALLPGILGGVLPRRAALAVPFVHALAALAVVAVLAALRRRPGGRVLAPLAGAVLAAATIASGLHLYLERWDRIAGAILPQGTDIRRILPLEKVLRGLDPEEIVLMPTLFSRFAFDEYARNVAALPHEIGRISTMRPHAATEFSCRLGRPFVWIGLDAPGYRRSLEPLRKAFRHREEVIDGFHLLHGGTHALGGCDPYRRGDRGRGPLSSAPRRADPSREAGRSDAPR